MPRDHEHRFDDRVAHEAHEEAEARAQECEKDIESILREVESSPSLAPDRITEFMLRFKRNLNILADLPVRSERGARPVERLGGVVYERILRNPAQVRAWSYAAYILGESLPATKAHIVGECVEKIRQAMEMLEYDRLDAEIFLRAWIEGAGGRAADPATLCYVVQENIKKIIQLENRMPGATTALASRFHIYNPGRYPVELLLRQCGHENTAAPYGIVLYPKSDENGAFYGTEGALRDLRSTLPDSYEIRILEAGDKLEAVRLFNMLKRSYGEAHKISFVVWGGHGSRDGREVTLGTPQEGKRKERFDVYADDITDYRMENLRALLADDATVILASCHTGVAGGVGERMSRVLGAKVIAPAEAAGLQSLRAEVKEGNLTFRVVYKEGKDVARRFG